MDREKDEKLTRYQLFKKNLRTTKEMVSMVWSGMTSIYGKSRARRVIFYTVLMSLLNVLLPLVLSIFLDSKLNPEGLRSNHGFTFWLLSRVAPGYTASDLQIGFIAVGLLLFFLLNFVDSVLMYYRSNVSEEMVCDNARHVDLTVLRRFFEKSVITHVTYEKHIGESTVKKGKDKARNIQDIILWQGISAVLKISLVYLALCYDYFWAGLIMTIGIFFYMSHSIYLNQEVLRVCNPLEKRWKNYNRYFAERLREFRKVIHNNKIEYEINEIMRQFDDIMSGDLPFWAQWYPWHNTVRRVGIWTVVTGVIAYGGYRMYHGSMSVGMFGSLVAWTTQIANSLWEIAMLEHQFNHATPAILSLKKAFDLPVGVTRNAPLKILPADSPFEIEFRNVSFKYANGDNKDFKLAGHLVLDNVSFKIHKGEKVALVGVSGMGKSTIYGILMGDMDPTSGEVYIDGYNRKDLDPGSVLDRLALIPQETEVLDGTVYDNVCYGVKDPKSVSRETVMRIVKFCNIDFLREEGLDTVVGTKGMKISGGQKQKIGVAMAMMKDPSLIVIDEGLSSLDATNKKEVQENLGVVLGGGMSALIVTHNLNAVRHLCDKFLFLDKIEEDKGSTIVAEAKSFEELAAKSSRFRELASADGVAL